MGSRKPNSGQFEKGQPPWNKGKKAGLIPWNKGKTGVYTEDTLEKFRNARRKQERGLLLLLEQGFGTRLYLGSKSKDL